MYIHKEKAQTFSSFYPSNFSICNQSANRPSIHPSVMITGRSVFIDSLYSFKELKEDIVFIIFTK